MGKNEGMYSHAKYSFDDITYKFTLKTIDMYPYNP